RVPTEHRQLAVHQRGLPRLGGVRARHPHAAAAARRAVHPPEAPGSGTRMKRLVQLAGPVLLIAIAGVWGSFLSNERAIEFETSLVYVAVVVSLYVFIGNSGVISFGQIGFFLVGAYASGELSIPQDTKSSILPNVFSVISDHSVGNFWSLVIAAFAGGLFAFLVGIPLMRLSGLAAGIATFAVLEITQNILGNWERIGPGPLTLSTVPQTTDLW